MSIPASAAPLRTTDPGELGLGLHAAPRVEEARVGHELDTFRPQPVGEPQREALRHDGARSIPRLRTARDDHLGADLGGSEARSISSSTPNSSDGCSSNSPSAASRGTSIAPIGCA